jgi:phosphotransferase system, enzyme I, PtsP
MLEELRLIVQRVSAAGDLSEALEIIVSSVKSSLNVSVCSIYLHDQMLNRYLLMATRGLNQEAVGNVFLGPKEGLVGMVASREEPINLEKADSHPNYQYIPETGEERYSSFLGVPIIHHRHVLGVLVVQQVDQRRFDEGEEAFLITLSAQLSGTIAHAESTGDLVQLIRPLSGSGGEIEFHGLAGAPGVSIGEAVIISPVADLYAVESVEARSVKVELEEYHQAVESTRKDIWNMAHGLSGIINEQERLLFTAYVQMLDDHSLGKEVKQRIHKGASAQSAWSEVIIAHARKFDVMEDAYLKERAVDLRDLGRRVLGHMQESIQQEIVYPEKAILVGEELSAAILGMVPVEKLAGLVSIKGSTNSHLAILARAMGIPTVVGVQGLRYGRLRGKKLIIDGYRGHVYINPTEEHISHYEAVREEDRQLLSELESLRDEPAVSLDNHKVRMLVNTGLMADVRISLERGAEGVGLYRSEVPFFTRQRFPTEEEQRQFYREQLEAFYPRPVVMRTLDIGGDKALPYFPIEEANPFLGWRGIRITLDHPEIFLAQARAMMKASIGFDNLRLLIPMISSVKELEMALELIYRAYDELTEEDHLDIKMPRIGAMIEVPSAVFLARELARRVDFLSVGSNDLTQYILAVDRNNPQVADLYQTMHPAVLSAINHVVKAAHAEGKNAGVCGELAGDPLGALLLMAMGYDSLSMNASNLLKVKAVIRKSNISEIRLLLREILHLPDADAVREALLELVTDPEVRRYINVAPGLG